MSNSIQIVGTVTLGPPGGVCEGSFPGASLQMQFGIGAGCGPCSGLPAPVSAYGTPYINSPGSYVALPGIGAGGLVAKVNTLYMKTQALLLLRLTFLVPSSSNLVVADIPLNGPWVQTFPDSHELVLLEVKGTANIEFLATGNS